MFGKLLCIYVSTKETCCQPNITKILRIYKIFNTIVEKNHVMWYSLYISSRNNHKIGVVLRNVFMKYTIINYVREG